MDKPKLDARDAITIGVSWQRWLRKGISNDLLVLLMRER